MRQVANIETNVDTVIDNLSDCIIKTITTSSEVFVIVFYLFLQPWIELA